MEENIEVRLARPEEAPLMAVLGAQVWLDTYARSGVDQVAAEYVLKEFAVERISALIVGEGSVVLLALMEGRLIGFAQVTLHATTALCDEARQAEIHRLYVQEAFTGRGVGTRLLHEIEAACPFWEVDAVWLSAWVGNERALEFYRKRDYTDSGQGFFGLGNDFHEQRIFVKITETAEA